MYSIKRTSQFTTDFKSLNDNQKYSLKEVIEKLSNDEMLDSKYKDHQLKGNMSLYRECHVKPDLLLIYKVDNEILRLYRIGSHSKLFG